MKDLLQTIFVAFVALIAIAWLLGTPDADHEHRPIVQSETKL